MTADEIPRTECGVCSCLSDKEYAFQKYGWPEHSNSLPDAAEALVIVRDFKPLSDRKLQLRQCPGCGAWFLYTSDYEYVMGTEDEQFLTRLTEEQAAEYLNRPDSA